MHPSCSFQVGNYTYFPSALLGKGSTGSVYRGIHSKNKNFVAIKVVLRSTLNDEPTRILFENEKKALKIIKQKGNSNVVRLYDIIEDGYASYLIMEECSGGTLQDYIKRKGFLSEQQTLEMTSRILHGSYSLIQQCILHRDIKPANIMLRPNQGVFEPVIIDLGYCEIILARKVLKSFNVGSPAYMSPQAFGKTMYSQKSQAWAIGVTMFEMLTSRTPDEGIPEKQYFELVKKKEFLKSIIGKLNISNETKTILEKSLMYLPEERITLSQMKYEIDMMLARRKKSLGSNIGNQPIVRTIQFNEPRQTKSGKSRSFFDHQRIQGVSRQINFKNDFIREMSSQKKQVFTNNFQRIPQTNVFQKAKSPIIQPQSRSNQRLVYPPLQLTENIPYSRPSSKSNLPPNPINFKMQVVSREVRTKTQQRASQDIPPKVMMMKIVTSRRL